MKRNTFSYSVLSLALAGFCVAFSGCSSKPSDSQLTSSVQQKIAADSALKGQTITAAAQNGTVTLTGNVDSEASRELAARDAAGVDGVKTVVNNLAATGPSTGENPMNAGNEAPATAPPATQAESSPPPQPAASVPPVPEAIVIPVGTPIRVRLGQTLSSKSSQTGQPFSGTLVSPVRVNGKTIIRSGAQANGTVTEAKSMGRFKGQAELALRLENIQADGRTYPVRTSRIARVEKGKGKRSAIMTGGGAGLGALIGGLAGGGKGAAIGLLAGGGAGAAGSAFTGNKDIVLSAETILTFDLTQSVTIQR